MKKVLIINATAIGENKGTGVTLKNIWKNYPRESIMQLIIDWQANYRDNDINTYQTPVEFCPIPYSLHRKLYKNRKNKVGVANGSIKQQGIKSCIHDCIRGVLDIFPVNYNCIIDRVRDFDPDIIYTCGPSIRVLKTANYISKKLDIPVVIHLMDNWPETIYTTSVLSSLFHYYTNWLLKTLHKKCRVNLAISDALAEKYSSIFGVEYKMLMNPAINISDNVCQISKSPKFLYAGSLNLNRWKSLLEIAKVISFYRNEELSLPFTLYVPQCDVEAYKDLFNEYGAVVNEYVSADRLQEIYKEYDVLVFAESFDEEVIDFAKYSLSTKIPEYMATGHLILGYLSEKLYSSQYLKDNEIAMVASNLEELRIAVGKIVSLDNECKIFAENALKKVKENHSIETCKERLLLAIGKTNEG